MATLLKSSGERSELLPAAGRHFTLNELQTAVGDTIALYGLYDGKILVCDDNGLSLGLPLNPEATAYYNEGREVVIYGISPVVGDVLICDNWEVV